MEENLFIYILRLESNKYYIGKTKDLFTRFEAHKKGTACTWTKKYKSVFVERVIEKASIFDEDKYTKEYMNKYGMDNVRGGAYVMDILPEDQIKSLMREITFANDVCFNCGSKGHFILNCTNNNNIISTNNNNINNNNNNINNNNYNNNNNNNNNNNVITSTKIVGYKSTENSYKPTTKNNYSKNNKQSNYKTTKNNEIKKPDFSNKGKKWTPNEDNDLCKFYESGISITEIAKIHQRTEYAIKKRLQKLGKLD